MAEGFNLALDEADGKSILKAMHRVIPEKSMELFNRIRAGHKDAASFAYYLEWIVFHMPAPRLMPALEWLIKNKLTGQRFLDFVNDDCKSSALEMFRHITMRLERESALRPIHRKDMI